MIAVLSCRAVPTYKRAYFLFCIILGTVQKRTHSVWSVWLVAASCSWVCAEHSGVLQIRRSGQLKQLKAAATRAYSKWTWNERRQLICFLINWALWHMQAVTLSVCTEKPFKIEWCQNRFQPQSAPLLHLLVNKKDACTDGTILCICTFFVCVSCVSMATSFHGHS